MQKWPFIKSNYIIYKTKMFEEKKEFDFFIRNYQPKVYIFIDLFFFFNFSLRKLIQTAITIRQTMDKKHAIFFEMCYQNVRFFAAYEFFWNKVFSLKNSDVKKTFLRNNSYVEKQIWKRNWVGYYWIIGKVFNDFGIHNVCISNTVFTHLDIHIIWRNCKQNMKGEQ